MCNQKLSQLGIQSIYRLDDIKKAKIKNGDEKEIFAAIEGMLITLEYFRKMQGYCLHPEQECLFGMATDWISGKMIKGHRWAGLQKIREATISRVNVSVLVLNMMLDDFHGEVHPNSAEEFTYEYNYMFCIVADILKDLLEQHHTMIDDRYFGLTARYIDNFFYFAENFQKDSRT